MRDARLICAASASLVLHVLVVIGASLPPHRSETGDAGSPPAPEPEIKLGIAESDHITMTWLGFKDPTPHEAQKSRTEQPLLTLAAPLPVPAESLAEPATPVPASSEDTAPQPTPLAPATPDRAADAENATPADPTGEPREAGEAPPTPEREPEPPQPQWIERAAARLLPLVRSLARGAVADPPIQASTPLTSRPQLQAAESSAAPASTPPERTPGQHDSEAAPTAVSDPVSWKPGETAAAKGLKITTRVPAKLSIPAELLSARIRPIFDISFARDGSVRSVEVVRSSGNVNVDEPWVSAMYGWRAEGADLDALDPNDPDAVITVQIQILPP